MIDPVALYRTEKARWQPKRDALMAELRAELVRHGVEVAGPDQLSRVRASYRKAYEDNRAKRCAQARDYYHRNKEQIALRRAAQRRAA
jgi:hypothetical protein